MAANDYPSLLRGTKSDDYRFQSYSFAEQIERAQDFLHRADAVLIGAGAGFSASAGLSWGDTPRWRTHFADFIKKYGKEDMPDMYTAGFYDFDSPEAFWGFWARDIYVNEILPEALPAYGTLLRLMVDKPCFVLTTNVDHQFYKAGFGEKNIFAMQGDSTLLCCARGCTEEMWEAGPIVSELVGKTQDCLVPTEDLPRCPHCGGPLIMQWRTPRTRLWWREGKARYDDFLARCARKNLLLLELGVGISSPMNIRFPFENLLREHPGWHFIRVSDVDAQIPGAADARAAGICADIAQTLEAMALA